MQSHTVDSLCFESTFLPAFYINLFFFSSHTLFLSSALSSPASILAPWRVFSALVFLTVYCMCWMWVFQTVGEKRRVCRCIASDYSESYCCLTAHGPLLGCWYRELQVYFQSGRSSSVECFQSSGPPCHGMEVGKWGWWDLGSFLGKGHKLYFVVRAFWRTACEAHSTKYYRRVVHYYKYKRQLLNHSFVFNREVAEHLQCY